MKRSRKRGFSLMEIIIAVVIMAIVATLGVSQLGKTTSQAKQKLDQHNQASLNEAIQRYYLERNRYPDRNLVYLTYYGYASEAKSGYKYYQYTPYGGIYRFNSSTKKVYR
jgi:general secretion pathway protein G